MIAHNGEINTIQGNRNWMRGREPELDQLLWAKDPEVLKPIILQGGSDSASLDNALEAIVMAGRDVLQAKSMLLPEAWENMPHMTPEKRGFFEYHSCLMEPWDGPAAITFSEGNRVGAILDRNGLRPARYVLTEDGVMILASEVGVIPIPSSKIIRKGRLGPGQTIAVDLLEQRILEDEEIKDQLVKGKPYARWVEKGLVRFSSRPRSPQLVIPSWSEDQIQKYQLAMGYTQEELDMLLKVMAIEGHDPVYSMGDDTPLSILSSRPRPLSSYFKQLFAQVTNPPIDPIREKLVMALTTYLGPSGNVFEESPEHARLIQLSSPVLDEEDLADLRNQKNRRFKTETLYTRFKVSEGAKEMEEALLSLCDTAAQAVQDGTSILILSDRELDARHARIPMLLAVAAVHHHLIHEGLRMRTSIIADTGDARDIHHFAALIGYGAHAVSPYLAMATISQLAAQGKLGNTEAATGLKNFKKAVETGLYKILSKMGISTLNSYHGAQIFEALGLKTSMVHRYFTGTFSKAGGVGLEEFAKEILDCHAQAFQPKGVVPLFIGGYYRFRREGEYHAFNPEVVKTLHKAALSGDPRDYAAYAQLVNNRPPTAIRDLLKFKNSNSIPLEEVEPVEEILKRFNTASISLGALSPETHMALAIAMNRIGGKSGSGEGGEDPDRFVPYPNGDSANSAIKQVASGRFGVTAAYLASARELEIKMAQGSKPGEGGQLPGKKVSEQIAKLRHSTPGVTLISPPPHHDIYSIEDLAQLIYDLKASNPRAKVNVKLVAESGVGTIAAGVAKAHADIILISGHDGGTGASPLSSIKHAGSAWELGLAETQQTLVLNDLRGRVMLRTDGGMKTGRDVVMAAILGAEAYGFGTAAMIAAGCCMVRQCHLNTCPVGVATQDPKLREKFKGTPEAIVHFMLGVAGEVRQILASIGKRSLQEIVGCPELLEPNIPTNLPKIRELDLDYILAQVDPEGKKARSWQGKRNDWEDEPLEKQVLIDAKEGLEGKGSVSLHYPIKNTDRSVGAMVAGEIGHRYVNKGLPPGVEIELRFTGTAGQSFGAWMTQGMRLILEGEANDYVGKGMSGGELALFPPQDSPFEAEKNVILGNTCFYGATGGQAFIRGRGGERFCVRNSGGIVVVEGVGDHGCEYMTGGMVLVLGPTGRNFGAGMTGGKAYVYDEEREFQNRYNPELIQIEATEKSTDVTEIEAHLKRHAALTDSPLAKKILKHLSQNKKLFWKVTPKESAQATVVRLPVEKKQAG
jgi:glutamate synthase (NADPH/NADH) large chain/glutamate synthase (ferredoxin)